MITNKQKGRTNSSNSKSSKRYEVVQTLTSDENQDCYGVRASNQDNKIQSICKKLKDKKNAAVFLSNDSLYMGPNNI